MRILIAVAIVLILAGGGCIFYSNSFPVYSDPDAPSRIANELESLPRETRFEQWYSQLKSFETPHKRISDVGRSLCAAGGALMGAVTFWVLYHRYRFMHSIITILILWWTLWLARIPLTIWYYTLRQKRHDYPWWGDSIGIGIYSECFTWIIGAVISTVVLALLLIRHPLPAKIRLVRPVSPYGWLRAIFIGGWLLLLANGVFWGVPEGDEGSVIISILAAVILLAFLSAKEASWAAEAKTNSLLPEQKPN